MSNKNNHKGLSSNALIIAAVVFVVIAVIVFVISLSLFNGNGDNEQSSSTSSSSQGYLENSGSSSSSSGSSKNDGSSSSSSAASSSKTEGMSSSSSSSSVSSASSSSGTSSSSSKGGSQSGNPPEEQPGRAQVIIENARLLLGTPFKDSGSDEEGFDSSGFIWYVMRKSGYAACSRDIQEQAVMGTARGFDEKQPGDILFFSNEIGSRPNFAGFYTGDGKMIGCLITSAFEGVVEVNINNSYYRDHFVAGVSIG